MSDSTSNDRDRGSPRQTGAGDGDRSGEVQANPYETRKTDLEPPAGPGAAEAPARPRAVPRAEPPDRLSGLELRPVETVAAGLPAIVESLRYTLGEMGPVQGLRMLAKINQVGGFDCAGCAWPDPDPDQRSSTEFCENGAKASAEENTRKRVGPGFFRRYGVAELSRRSDYWLARQGRITEPMVLRRGATHYEPIPWDDAFRMVADELKALDSPDEAIFYTSGRTANETAFLYQLFARQFGTNNLPDCSNMCHESSGSALTETIGIGKGTVTLDDVLHTDLLISIGQNPGTCHPRMLTALQTAKRNGARIVAVNPLPETGLNHFKHPQDLKHPLRALAVLTGEGTPIADLFLPVRINGDVALLKGVMKEMV
ncbi:MAG TPA: molybdopterin-dependent oxidoreductase, partial [Longimicrobiaceae bacterium]|nr:molybdopterin-dependent oxidoreductase [Longimicrobiaceae bacterium]